MVGIESNKHDALEFFEIDWTILVQVSGVNTLGCGVMILGASVENFLLMWMETYRIYC